VRGTTPPPWLYRQPSDPGATEPEMDTPLRSEGASDQRETRGRLATRPPSGQLLWWPGRGWQAVGVVGRLCPGRYGKQRLGS
jgi:hypothetical protein